jgi:predicted nucleotidyltransferase
MKSKSVGDLEALQQVLKGLMPELQTRYGVKSLGVFGSYATGRQKKRSDVDLLVEFDGHVPVTLFKFLALELELGKAIGHRVDLVERDTLKPVIGKRILEEVKPV